MFNWVQANNRQATEYILIATTGFVLTKLILKRAAVGKTERSFFQGKERQFDE